MAWNDQEGNGKTASNAFSSTSQPSLISSDLKIDGNLTCEGAIQIDGKVNGDINSKSLTIGESAEVSGVVTADNVAVHGHMEGEIRSQTVQIMSTAKYAGDIFHETLAVEAGAQIEGQVRRMDQQRSAKVQHLQQPQKSSGKAKIPAGSNGATDGDSPRPN